MDHNSIAAEQLQTPYIMIDEERTDRNIARMAEAIKNKGVSLRPHIKTHKMPELALKQLAAGATGITVAKLSEAEVMANAGIKDIFVAYPIVSKAKIERAVKLAATGIRLITGVDNFDAASLLARAAANNRLTIEVRLEIETGLLRTGVLPSKAVELAQAISKLRGLKLTGIFTYRGAILDGSPTTDLQAAGHEEGKLLVEVAETLRAAGIPVKDVSAGSTSTALYAAQIEGITEVRPGTYIFQDCMQAAFGVCNLEDTSALVWATVVSRPAPNRIIIDGGSKAFATDAQPGKAPLYLKGFGHIVGDPDALFERMSEEHGIITVRPESVYAPGDRLTIIPNHICPTVNLYNEVIIKNKDGDLRRATIAARGMSQ